MHRHQDDVLLGRKPQQGCADQGPLRQIEAVRRLVLLGPPDRVGALGRVKAGQIHQRQPEWGRLVD
ncbi:hypothetical protein D3C87_1094870 [compost metagenome]